MVSRMVTLSGAAYVMPRSWHSAMSYFNFRLTGSPQRLQNVEILRLNVPHFEQTTSSMENGFVMITLPHERQLLRRCDSPFRLVHLHSQLPIEKSTNSKEETPRKSLMGNTELKTACSPMSSLSAGRRF